MNMLDPRNIKIAYIGGGSRGWAWKLMRDLARETDICGTVALYDIDRKAAQDNAAIGNYIAADHEGVSPWRYEAADTLEAALTGAHFIVISILPGTFEEMASDVHAPEAYGVYQSVGDTTGPGGYVRALRTIPMFETIACAVRDYAPEAWVINYTNPMAMCVGTLYRVFPGIKAFGCCHEVFGTQELLCRMTEEMLGVTDVTRGDIKVNVLGVNHFTWLDKASYKGVDLMPLYRQYAEKYVHSGSPTDDPEKRKTDVFSSGNQVKFDLFLRTGYIAAAGDRHLAEFCPADWYMKFPEMAEGWGFHLTPVSWRKNDLVKRLAQSRTYLEHRAPEGVMPLGETGEEGVKQIKAIMGMGDLVTNVNLPNVGQIPNLPLGTIVETNACFTSDSVRPVMAGPLPAEVLELSARPAQNQTDMVTAVLRRSHEEAFAVFSRDRLLGALSQEDKRALFDRMVAATKAYLPRDWDKTL